VKEPNMFHNYEIEKITRKDSDTAEYIKLLGMPETNQYTHGHNQHRAALCSWTL